MRFGHWALVIAFAVAYLNGEEEGEASELHEWAGYIVGGIIVWRVVWGLIGPRYARFSDFVKGPKESLRYLVSLIMEEAICRPQSGRWSNGGGSSSFSCADRGDGQDDSRQRPSGQPRLYRCPGFADEEGGTEPGAMARRMKARSEKRMLRWQT